MNIDLKERFEVATAEEVAKFFDKTAESLANDRCNGVGPPYIKVGKQVLYPLQGLRKYLEARTVTSEETHAPTLIHGVKRRGRASTLSKAA